MTSGEIDMLCIGVSAGLPAGLWLGYALRRARDRWRDRSATAREAGKALGRASRAARQAARHVPFGDLSTPAPRPQRRTTPRRGSEVIPLSPPRWRLEAEDPQGGRLIPVDQTIGAAPDAGALREARDRAAIVCGLVDSGFKRAEAVAAADACSKEERADLTAWMAAAFRRARSSK